MSVWLYTIASVLIVSLISLIGIITLTLKEKVLKNILLYSISFAAGCFLGDVFFHLLPGNDFNTQFSVSILSGIIIFFVLEKFIRWRHCHELASKNHPHPISFIILFGDIFHNFIDGLIIGASYLANTSLGIATTIAVFFHEIPQEIGDFSALIYGGFSKGKALLYNFLSALTAIVGAVIILIIGSKLNLINFLIPITAGGFIYIAASDLIPELHKEVNIKKSIVQLVFFIFGIIVMFLLTYLG